MPDLAILAGGMATRLGDISYKTPKALIQVGGEPFIAHQLRLAAREGIKRAVLCVGHLFQQIEDFVGNGAQFGLSVSYSWDGARLLGTGGALKKALPMLSDPFMVLYGDSYLDTKYSPIVAQFYASGKPGLMTVFDNDNQWDLSNVEFQRGIVVRYDKKNPDPEMRHIDYGLSILSKQVFDALPTEKPFDLADVFERLILSKHLGGYEVTERFYEIGSPEGLRETSSYLSCK